jgi:hypothetical protein
MAYGGIIATNFPLTQRHDLVAVAAADVGLSLGHLSAAIPRPLVDRGPLATCRPRSLSHLSSLSHLLPGHVVNNQPNSQRARQNVCLLPSTRRSSAAVADDFVVDADDTTVPRQRRDDPLQTTIHPSYYPNTRPWAMN